MARLLSNVSGHQEIIERLLSAHRRGHLPSTFLFVGPSGVGRAKVAMGLAQAVACERSPDACGECGSCLRIVKNQSESLLMIEPEKTQIKIEQAHQVLEFLSLKSVSKARSVIIRNAESLNPQAANTLLKILEEPPASTYFFLIAPSARHVLATLRSRSQIVRFGALSEYDLGVNMPAPDWALKSAMGSFEKLRDLLGSEEIKTRALAWQILNEWHRNRPIFMDEGAREWMRDRGTLLALARYWILAFRDALVYQAGERVRLFNSDHIKGVELFAEMGPQLLSTIMRRAFDLESGLLAQRDAQLSFEEFWIQTRREVEGAQVASL